jgi:hypothetical protein
MQAMLLNRMMPFGMKFETEENLNKTVDLAPVIKKSKSHVKRKFYN